MTPDLQTLFETIGVAGTLRAALGKLDSLGLVAAAAFVDQALHLVDEEISDQTHAQSIAVLDDSAFALMDDLIARLYDTSSTSRQCV